MRRSAKKSPPSLQCHASLPPALTEKKTAVKLANASHRRKNAGPHVLTSTALNDEAGFQGGVRIDRAYARLRLAKRVTLTRPPKVEVLRTRLRSRSRS